MIANVYELYGFHYNESFVSPGSRFKELFNSSIERKVVLG